MLILVLVLMLTLVLVLVLVLPTVQANLHRPSSNTPNRENCKWVRVQLPEASPCTHVPDIRATSPLTVGPMLRCNTLPVPQQQPHLTSTSHTNGGGAPKDCLLRNAANGALNCTSGHTLPASLIQQVILAYHSYVHNGIEKTLLMVDRKFCFHGLTKADLEERVKQVCDSCAVC